MSYYAMITLGVIINSIYDEYYTTSNFPVIQVFFSISVSFR